jgi:hypothetical protein
MRFRAFERPFNKSKRRDTMDLPMRLAPLLALLSLPAFADVFTPTLDARASEGNLVLHLEGTADIPRAAADWAPLVDVEYLFVPLRVERQVHRLPGLLTWKTARVVEGREVSLGFGRARIVSDAVEDNSPYLDARPFVVAGQFAGLYRARLVLDPARQSVRLRARSLPAAAATAEARWGDPVDLARMSSDLRKAVEEDAYTLQILEEKLEALWQRWRTAPRVGDDWGKGLESWRARFELLPARNDLRPAHGIVEWMPAARSAIGEACEALVSLADACERVIGEPVEKRTASREVEAALGRARGAMAGLIRAAARREPAPDAERVSAAIGVLREAPRRLLSWVEAWRAGKAGHTAADWPAERARIQDELTGALFLIGRAAPAGSYEDLAGISRLLFADAAPAGGRNPSLLAAISLRILKETSAPPDEDWLSWGRELAERLGRVEKVLGAR